MFIVELIIIQLVIFIIILYLLKKFVYSDIANVVERLKKLQAENLQREEELKDKINKAKKEYDLKMLRGEEEMKKLKEDAKVEAQKLREEILQNARQEGESILKDALIKKEDIRLELEVEMEEKAVLLSQKIIKSFFSSYIIEGIHHQLIDEVLNEVTRLDSKSITGNVGKIVIITPIPLSPSQRDRLNNFVSLRLNKKIDFEENIDKTIIAGLIIKLDSLMLDGSLKTRLGQVLRSLREIKK